MLTADVLVTRCVAVTVEPLSKDSLDLSLAVGAALHGADEVFVTESTVDLEFERP